MSDSTNTSYPGGFEAYSNEYQKILQQQQGLDLFSFAPTEVAAPHPDLFDTELDSSLAGFDEYQLQLLTVDTNDFSFLRSDTPTRGPPSTITVSSESAYDSLSSHSESFYNYPNSPYSASNYSFPLDLEMDFRRIRVDGVREFPPTQTSTSALEGAVDPTSFGALPPTPPRSPANHSQAKQHFEPRNSFSDYGPPTRSTGTAQYFDKVDYASRALGQHGVSPDLLNARLPIVPSIPMAHPGEELKGDPRKKYKCATCPRAFARAYNLKTHMATHDPNRLKPHVCPHRSCGRSFSRKHDLGRHLISIHRDDSICSSQHSASSEKSIGVEKAPRAWCDRCGKGSVGRTASCDCADVK